MIKFFRRIRQKLISENRIRKYLFYAIGEIILVVIGILIALQINNANENRKNEESIRIVLKQIHSELAENIKEVNVLNRYYQRQDSAIRLMMNDEIDLENYRGNYDSPIRSNRIIVVKDEGFKSLIANADNIPHELDGLISKMKELFITQKEQVEFSNNAIDNTVKEYENWLKLNANWFKESFYNQERIPTEEEIEFYTSNKSLFKNFVLTYHLNGPNGIHFSANEFRHLSYSLYKELSKLLNLKEEDVASFSISLTQEQKKQILGTYTFNDRFVEIFEKEGKIYSKSKSYGETEVFILTENTFSVDYRFMPSFYSFINEEDKGITGIKVSNSNNEIIFKKVK